MKSEDGKSFQKHRINSLTSFNNKSNKNFTNQERKMRILTENDID